MGLFTIEFEIGRETRSMIERVVAQACAAVENAATNAAVELELGEKARETVVTASPHSETIERTRDAVGGIAEKAHDEAKGILGG